MKTYYYYAGAEEHLIVEEERGARRVLHENAFSGDLKILFEKMFEVPDVPGKGPYGSILYALEWMDLVANAILDIAARTEEGWTETDLGLTDIMPDDRLIAASKTEVTL